MIVRLFRFKAGPFILALIAGAVALGAFLLPQKEEFSSDGFGIFGKVDVTCGSVASREVNADFDDSFEQDAYDSEVFNFGEPYIFEGKTASQVCDESLKSTKTTALVAAGIAGLLLVVGFVRLSKAGAGNNPPASAPPPPPAPPLPPPPVDLGAPPPPVVPDAPPPPSADASAMFSALPRPPEQSSPFGARPPAVADPPPPASMLGEHDGRTVPRSSLPTVPDALRFNDGSSVTLGAALFVGRDPLATGPGSTHRVNDTSVSKTHLSITRRDGQVWVEDLHSTNGTTVRAANGEIRTLRPGVALVLAVGDTVEFGDQTCALEVRQ